MKPSLRVTLAAIVLASTLQAQPSNDDFFSPRLIPSETQVSTAVSNRGATGNLSFEAIGVLTPTNFNGYLIPPEGAQSNEVTGVDYYSDVVWYSWTPPVSGKVSLRLESNQNEAAALAIFEDQEDGTFALVGAADSVFVLDLGMNVIDWFFTQAPVAVSDVEVEGGRNYRVAYGGWSGEQGNATLELTLAPVMFADDFEDAVELFGRNITLTGNNSDATGEDDEPNHGGGPGGRSVWFKYKPDVQGAFIVSTEGSAFDTVIAIYQGDELGNLTLIDSNLNATRDVTFSRLRTLVKQGEEYYLVVDRGGFLAGEISLSMRLQPLPPTFITQPKDTPVEVGTDAVLVSDAIGTDALAYRWQRRPASGGAWITLVNGPVYSGVTTPVITVIGTTLEMSGDLFRVVVEDASGNSTSRAAKLVVTPFPPLLSKIGGVVEIDLKGGDVMASGTQFFARRLPRGLSLDRDTGLITGVLSGNRTGSFVVDYWTQDADGRSATRQLSAVIEAFPEELIGNYEALLVDVLGLPVGKAEVRIAANGAYTARLTTDDRRVLSARGSLRLNGALDEAVDSTLTRGNPVRHIALRAVVSDQRLEVVLSEANGNVAATELGESLDGRRLPDFARGEGKVEWDGFYTLAFAPGVDFGTRDVPPGSSWAGGTINARGNLALRGTIADGSKFTANLLPGADADYLLYAKPFRSRVGYLAGWIPLELNPQVGVYRVAPGAGGDIYLSKPAIPNDRTYREGFGPVGLNLRMHPWRGPLFLGTAVELVVEGPGGVENTAENPFDLPVLLVGSGPNRISVPSPNPSNFKAALNNATGLLSGSFDLVTTDDAGKISRTTIRYEGVALADFEADENDPLIEGYFLVPGANRGDPLVGGSIQFLVPPEPPPAPPADDDL